VRRSDKRKTVQLTVDRGGELIISAPPGVEDAFMADFVREKRFWLYTKIAEKEARRQAFAPKEFVSGEGFPYLGRSYRLLLVEEQAPPLKLQGGRFKLRRALTPQGRDHFIRWYTDHAHPWLGLRTKAWAARMGLAPTGIEVRDLGFRWGSCGQNGVVNFNWATILLPPSIVDYVIVHELAHLHEALHTPAFWLLVERALPGCQQQRDWLAQHGSHQILI